MPLFDKGFHGGFGILKLRFEVGTELYQVGKALFVSTLQEEARGRFHLAVNHRRVKSIVV